MTDFQKIFNFTIYLEAFKKIERFAGHVFWREYPFPVRYESTADHTWRMAMMLVVLERRLRQPIDFKKAMTMMLIHDVPEIIAGDASPLGESGTGSDSHAYNPEIAKKKAEREEKAAHELFAQLPHAEAAELLELWREYEAQSSVEARIVKALDKFEGKLQAFQYTKGVWFKEHFDFMMKYGVETFTADPALQELGDILLREMRENYTEFKR